MGSRKHVRDFFSPASSRLPSLSPLSLLPPSEIPAPQFCPPAWADSACNAQVSDYWLNRRIRAQSEAFMRGLRDLVRPEWIRAFSPLELQARARPAPRRGLLWARGGRRPRGVGRRGRLSGAARMDASGGAAR